MKSSSLMFSVLSVVAQNIEQVALLSVHHRDDLKAASDPKAAANLTDVGSNRYHQQRLSPGPYVSFFTELLFVVDVFLEAASTAQEHKLFVSMLLHMSIPRILALACDQNASDRQWELFFDEMHASHRCATDTRPSRPGAPSHQAERGCSGLSLNTITRNIWCERTRHITMVWLKCKSREHIVG